jgi:polysaccharide export outer membrane protein
MRRARIGVLAATLGLGALVGCEVDSWFDPSVVGRWERTPVVLPILDRLDVIDEPPAKAPGTTSVQPEDLVPEVREYVIGPGDLITFTVFELIVPNVESVQTRRVDELGQVRLPVVGTVQAGGLTPSELERSISQTLERNDILRDATVSVIVQEGRQKTYSVIGEPQVAGTGIGTYTIPHPDFRLLEAMALARGVPGRIKTLYVIRQHPEDKAAAQAQAPTAAPTDAASIVEQLLVEGDVAGQPEPTSTPPVPPSPPAPPSPDTGWQHVEGQWVRQSASAANGEATPNQRIIEIPYTKLLGGDMQFNIVIRPGDIIRVPAPVIGNIYIGGSINRPGTYALPGDKDLTLKQLIFAAGNLSPFALPERLDLIRRVGDDQEAIVRLNLRAIFEGRQPDFYLKPNDTINVGTSWIAPPLAVIRNGFRTTYGFGFVLDRNFDDKVFGQE